MSLNGSGGELVYQARQGLALPHEDGSRIEQLDRGGQRRQRRRVLEGHHDRRHAVLLRPQPACPAGHERRDELGLDRAGVRQPPGEPCHAATFAASFCAQAWRWNLDYVVDPHGNTMSYWYDKETNQYAKNATATDKAELRARRLARADRLRHLGPGASDRSVHPDRHRCCLRDRRTAARPDCADHGAAHWKDVPWDQDCAPGRRPAGRSTARRSGPRSGCRRSPPRSGTPRSHARLAARSTRGR